MAFFSPLIELLTWEVSNLSFSTGICFAIKALKKPEPGVEGLGQRFLQGTPIFTPPPLRHWAGSQVSFKNHGQSKLSQLNQLNRPELIYNIPGGSDFFPTLLSFPSLLCCSPSPWLLCHCSVLSWSSSHILTDRLWASFRHRQGSRHPLTPFSFLRNGLVGWNEPLILTFLLILNVLCTGHFYLGSPLS